MATKPLWKTGDDTNDFGDLEAISEIVNKSAGTLGDSQLSFAFPEVLDVIHLCSANQIAVLGVERFKARDDGLYQIEKRSRYDLLEKGGPSIIGQWLLFVEENNAQAEEFVRRKRSAGHDRVYVLTTSSWPEIGKLEKSKKMRP